MEPSRPVLLDVAHLVKQFPIRGSREVVHAVSNVSFQVHAGETVALVGESGSGKTTVGRCILKLVDQTSGRIRFGEHDITAMRVSEFRSLRPRLQMVFQEPYGSLNPRFTVGGILEENLVLEGKLGRAERRARVRELLSLIQLPVRMLTAYPHELTSGQQQRVSIGRALSTRPDLIVLDEPTSALDVNIRAEIIRLLKSLQVETGVSYLFISHDLTAVMEISHRVVIMYLGEIVEIAPNPAIFQEQFHPYSKALLASVLLPNPESRGIRAEALTLASEIPSPVHLPSGCYLHPRCPFALGMCTSVPTRLDLCTGQRWSACHRAAEFVAGVPETEMLDSAAH